MKTLEQNECPNCEDWLYVTREAGYPILRCEPCTYWEEL